MPDENGFATPEERGDFVPDSDNPPPETTADAPTDNADAGVADAAADSTGADGGDDSSADAGIQAGGEADPDASADGGEGSADDAEAAAEVPASAEAGEATADAAAAGTPVEGAAETSVEAGPSTADTKDAPEAGKTPEGDTRARPRIQRVPKNRFDIKVKQLAAARERIAELEAEAAKNATDQTSTIQTLNAQLLERNQAVAAAVKDGTGDIAALMLEAQATQQLITDARIAEATQYTATEVDHKSEFRRTLDDVESVIPTLQPGHADYNQEEVDQVSELTQTFQKAGQSAAEAVLRAVGLLYPDEADAPPPPIVGGKPTPKAPGTAKKTDVAKNLQAAKKTPPPLAAMGEDSNKLGVTKEIDVTKLTEKEFDALPVETLKRLRGDTFAG